MYPTFDFSVALRMVKRGDKIRREDWNRPSHVEARLLSDGSMILAMVMKDGTWGPYTPSHCDIWACDWTVI